MTIRSASSEADILVLGHITDPHLDGRPASHERLIRVIDELASHATPVDALILTGDIVEAGDTEEPEQEYAFARSQAERLGVPVLYCPGNSDTHAAGSGGAIRLPGLTVLALDSRIPGSFAGSLAAADIGRAREVLGGGPEPVLLALHHPPIALGHAAVDAIGLTDSGPLASWVADEPRIIGILAGHTHAATVTTFAGRPLVLARGIHSEGRLPHDLRDPWRELIDESADPGYALHLVTDGRLVSYFRSVRERS